MEWWFFGCVGTASWRQLKHLLKMEQLTLQFSEFLNITLGSNLHKGTMKGTPILLMFYTGTALAPHLSISQLPLGTQLLWSFCWVSEAWGGWKLPWIVRASPPWPSASSSRWMTGRDQQRYSEKLTRWGEVWELTNIKTKMIFVFLEWRWCSPLTCPPLLSS